MNARRSHSPTKAARTMQIRTLDAAILGVLIAGAWMPVQAQSAQPAAVSTAQSAPAARGRYSLDLPNGGLIWATEDPTLTSPLLNVQGSAVAAFVSTGNRWVTGQRLEVSGGINL